MSATFQWVVEWMNCYPEYQGEQDVVFQVGWRCLGSETVNGNEFSNSLGAPCEIKLTAGSPIIPYADLTQDQVLEWCFENGVGKDSVEAQIQSNIDAQSTPQVVKPPLPWDQI